MTMIHAVAPDAHSMLQVRRCSLAINTNQIVIRSSLHRRLLSRNAALRFDFAVICTDECLRSEEKIVSN